MNIKEDPPNGSMMTTFDSPTWDELLGFKSVREMILWFQEHPDHWVNQRELSEQADVSYNTISRNIEILVDAGICQFEQRGSAKYYRLDESSNVIEALEMINYELSRRLMDNNE